MSSRAINAELQRIRWRQAVLVAGLADWLAEQVRRADHHERRVASDFCPPPTLREKQ